MALPSPAFESVTVNTTLDIPAGTVAERPVAGNTGMMRYNTTNSGMEIDNGTRYVPLASQVIRVDLITSLKAYDTTNIGADHVAILSRSGATVGFGPGIFDFQTASTLTPDDIIVVRPNGISGSNPGRWIRRLDGGVLPADASAGIVADYVFPSGGSGEVTGTDNSTALNALLVAASTQSTSKRGITVRLGAGCYRIASAVTMPPGVRLEGVGSHYNGAPGDARMDTGSILVYDGNDALLNPDTASIVSGMKFLRRGMDKNPTSGQVNTYWADRLNDLHAGKQWVAATVYSTGDIRVNLNNVYKCTTGGTSAATNTGGPLGQSTASDSIIDNTAKWQFLHEFSWERGRAYPVNTVILNGHRVYQCDTAGTSSSSGFGPTGTTATTNGITDGTAKWHWIGSLSCAIRPTSYMTVEDCSISGFSRAICVKEGISLRNVTFDALLGIDQQHSGDMTVYENVKARALYTVSGATTRRHGVAFYAHGRVDGIHYKSCGSQLWAVGICVSNAWAQMSGCYIETATTTRGDACVQLRNGIQGFQASDNYFNGVIGWDIAATNSTRASVSVPSGVTTTSEINIQGGWYVCVSAAGFTGDTDTNYTSTAFRFTGAAVGQIRGANINAQGRVPFQAYAVSSPTAGEINWDIKEISIVESAYPDYTMARLATLDSSVAPYFFFADVRHSTQNRQVVPPGLDRSVDRVASPTSAGSRTVPNGVALCRLNGSGTLTSYTVTMPPNPIDGQVLTISTKTAITTLTVAGNGATMAAAPTSATAEQSFTFRYLAVDTIWLRIS